MPRDSIYLFEQADFCVRVARCSDGGKPLRIDELKEVSITEAAALMANLPPDSAIICASRPKLNSMHLASADEARRHVGIAGIRRFVEFSGPAKWMAAVRARDGGEISDGPWLLSSSTEAQSAAITALEAASPKSLQVIAASIASAGAVAALASCPVLLIDIGELASHAMLVGREGVLAAGSIALDLSRIGEAVQTELSLKFRGSAVKLFFNAEYDFTESGPKIAARLAETMKADLGRFLVDRPAPTELFVTGLPATQQWFGTQLAHALGLAPHAPDLNKWCTAAGLSFSDPGLPSTLSPTWLTILHSLQCHNRSNPAATKPWQAAWMPVATAVPVVSPTPVAASLVSLPTAPPTRVADVAPAAKTAIPAPVLPKKPATPTSPPAESRTASALNPTPPVPSAPKSSPDSTDVTPTKSLIAAASAKTPVPATRASATLSPDSAKPAGPLVLAATQSSTRRSGGSVPPLQTQTPRLLPAAPTKNSKNKFPSLLIVGGVAACLMIAAFFYMGSQSKRTDQLAHDKEQAELRLKSAAEKARIAELKAEDEANARRKIEVEFTQKLVDSESARQQVETELAAETAARRANARGSLVITTEPAGATVTVGNLPPQISPATFSEIRVGTYPVRITLPRYEEMETELAVAENATTESGVIPLVAAAGSLQIHSDPADARFELRPANALITDPATRRSGQTPAELDDLIPGDYQITLAREGWAAHSQVVSISRGATTHLRWSWPNGVVRIISNPPGATVSQGDKWLGLTPLTLSEQAPGMASYHVTLDRYEPTALVGEVVRGKTVELAVEFNPRDRIWTSAEVDRKPDAVGAKQLEIPYYLTLEGGKVELQLTVKRDGSISNLTVLSASNPELGKYCAASVAKWLFKPGMKGGTPVKVSLKLPFVFKPSK